MAALVPGPHHGWSLRAVAAPVNLKRASRAAVGDEVTSLHLNPPTAEVWQPEKVRDSLRRLLHSRGSVSGLTGQESGDIVTKMQLLQTLIIHE